MRNLTRKKTLVTETKTLSSSWAKGLGLMFRPAPTYAAIFPFSTPRRVSIHMWFVFFPLDVAWLDKEGTILEAKTLRPWTHHTPKQPCAYVVEFPQGTFEKTKTRAGDQLLFQE